jgi:hypothetical protein
MSAISVQPVNGAKRRGTGSSASSVSPAGTVSSVVAVMASGSTVAGSKKEKGNVYDDGQRAPRSSVRPASVPVTRSSTTVARWPR